MDSKPKGDSQWRAYLTVPTVSPIFQNRRRINVHTNEKGKRMPKTTKVAPKLKWNSTGNEAKGTLDKKPVSYRIMQSEDNGYALTFLGTSTFVVLGCFPSMKEAKECAEANFKFISK